MGHGYMREYDEDSDRGEMRDRGSERGNQDKRDFMMGNRNWDEDRNRNSGRSRSDNFQSHQDDHYRSWRDKQMEALDRDYADYCREREQQFHSDFDSWRSQRRDTVQPLQPGMTQTSNGRDPEGTLDLSTSLETSSQAQPAIADAAVGTAPNRNRR